MGDIRHKGFTVIEVMLVLGIVGVVMAFMLVGLSAQLNRHRYQDATSSLLAYMQKQYDLVANVNNSRTTVDASLDGCSTTNNVAGTSDCTIVGRIIHAGNISGGDVDQINAEWVVAKADVAGLATDASVTGQQILQKSLLVEQSTEEPYSVRWGTRLVKAVNHSEPLSFSMLIVRIPTTGVVSTYVSNSVDATPDAIVQANDSVADLKVCVDPVGLLGAANDPVGILIERGAANSSGVQQLDQGKCV